jgi:hypothetical protein
MSMSNWRRYKDVLCHPGSELEKHLAAGEPKKAEEVYKRVTNEGYARGEFLKQVPIEVNVTVTINNKEH